MSEREEFEYYFTMAKCEVGKLVREIKKELNLTFAGNIDGYIVYISPSLRIVSFRELTPAEEDKLNEVVSKHKPVVWRYLVYKPVKTKMRDSMAPDREVTLKAEAEVLEFDQPQDIEELQRKFEKKVEKYTPPL